MKITSFRGYLYLEYWDKDKGYTWRESLKMKDTQVNRREAKKIKDNFKLTGIKYVKVSKERLKLSQALNVFLEYKNPKPKTKYIYTQSVNHFITAAGDKFIDEYTHQDYVLLLTYFRKPKTYLLDYRSDKKDKKKITKVLSTNSQSIYTRSLKALFNYFIKHKYLTDNIIETIPPAEALPTPIDKEDLDKILGALKRIPHQYALASFLVHTGIRKSTALDLCWEDIDWKNNLITFRNIKIGSKQYQFPLITKLREILQTLEPKKSGKVFPYKNVESLKFFSKIQNQLTLNRHYSIHKLKHTFVSHLVNNGMSLEDVSELTNTTLRTLKKNYLKMDKQRIADKLETMNIG